MGQDEALENLMGNLGEFGTYQMIQFGLHILAALTAGMHMLSLVTVAAVPPHRCAIPKPVENETEELRINYTVSQWYDTYSRWSAEELAEWLPPGRHGGVDSCKLLEPETNGTRTCDRWVYDTQYYKSSRGMEWNFVCENRWKGAVAQSSYMFGVFAGAVTLGSMADKFGRKTIFYVSAILQLILGVGVAFVEEYYFFLITMFLYGIFGSAGSYITGFVLTMELVGASYRTICGIAFQATFAVGIMLVAFWGYFIQDRVWLQVVYGMHSALLIFHWWLIDESPRWLWAQGRISEAVNIVDKAIRLNGGDPIDKARYISKGKAASSAVDDQQSYSVLDMFRTPKLRLKSLNVCLNWFANSLVYYGLALNTGNLAGNPYLILFIMGIIEMPSYIMTVLLLDKVGRRFITATFLLMGGIACLSAAFTPKGVITTSIVFIGKFCIAGSFAVIYNYSAEMFPTVIRNTALGVGSMCARLSATLTPLITLLDSFDPRVPTVLFATVALVSGILTMFLPETLNQQMPQSLDDGEHFGEGDNCFKTGCFGSRNRRTLVPMEDKVERKAMQT